MNNEPEQKASDEVVRCIHGRDHTQCTECLAEEYRDEPDASREFINGGW